MDGILKGIMKIEVKRNTKRNIIFGFLNKIVLLLFPFFIKAFINTYLGTEYLGLNSLFTSILSVLSLTELGISSALVYHMYKPIAEDDTEKICALLNFYRKAYLLIGIVTSCIGILILPFLPNLINGDWPQNVNIYVIYLIQLLANSISYFLFGYKQSLLVAYQREDINSIINLLTQSGMQIVQILLLVTVKNYYFYVICIPVFTVINNLWIWWFTRRLFPDIRCSGKLEPSDLKSIKKLVIGSFIQKACAVTRNSLDSVCISAFVGLTITGIYNNYFTIFNGVIAVLGIIITSLMGGIGNHVAIKSKVENYEELRKIDFLYMLISGWCTCCLLCLSQPFMKLWMGKAMLLSPLSVLFMCIYFYMLKVGDVRSIYYSTTGMWWEMRYRSIVETIVNLVLNIVLGYYFGINGIILATVISLFFINFLWGASIVFKNYFGLEKLEGYFLYHFKYFCVTLLVCFITWNVIVNIELKNAFADLVVKGIVCVIVPAILYILVYCRTTIFKSTLQMVRKKGIK